MEYKRRRELARDMDRYLASRKRKKINFRKLFRMPLEIKPVISRLKRESDKKEETFYESHTKKAPFYQAWIESLKGIFRKKQPSEEEYVEYRQLEKEKSGIEKEAGPKKEQRQPEFEPSSKKGWLKALIDTFRPSKNPEYSSYPVEEEIKVNVPAEYEKLSKMKEDIKQVSKIALSTIKKLPKAEIENFRKTADFAKLKDILRKHNLIK